MSLRITRLNGTLGARVEGIDFAAGLGADLFDALASALWEHQVIAVPARGMSPQQHLQIARHFGEPEHNATEYFQRIEGVPAARAAAAGLRRRHRVHQHARGLRGPVRPHENAARGAAGRARSRHDL